MVERILHDILLSNVVMPVSPNYSTKLKGRLSVTAAMDIRKRPTLREASYKGEFGQTVIDVPRDRNGEFEPIIVKKGQTRFDGFDGKILSLYLTGDKATLSYRGQGFERIARTKNREP
ncbi:MAG: hypothetical protein HC827_05810 [Cyanobacteria bacterium RM1_2_2]|nr:hypothetical protein [Cyanobacteria bacterium RM1_2_2]